ncbi:DUF1467 family protein [Sphingomonas sp. AX6]|uniref:DUF1467 family protein n=1 Tax=Sphingomonas sp. AX6 TaxID=2653171 RepID=UPI0012F0A1B4|nr:DUF1467 family protein [Sphingomonas sp. AX6]VXC94313.1 conserved hypothetical protein [Sphingomonas sp. AX6]
MQIQSIVAIYFLFWVLSVFVVLPFGMKTADEAGVAKVPGQAESAPVRFSLGEAAIRATVVSAVVFGLFYANWHYGWLTADMFAFQG